MQVYIQRLVKSLIMEYMQLFPVVAIHPVSIYL